jgi:hypothetical protein
MGMSGYMSGMMAQNLRVLIQQSINPDSWYDLYPDTAEGQIMVFPDQQPKKLAVWQSPEVHRQIEDLLDQLRKSLGRGPIERGLVVMRTPGGCRTRFDMSYNSRQVGLATLTRI